MATTNVGIARMHLVHRHVVWPLCGDHIFFGYVGKPRDHSACGSGFGLPSPGDFKDGRRCREINVRSWHLADMALARGMSAFRGKADMDSAARNVR